MLPSTPYPSSLNDHRIKTAVSRFRHSPSACCSNIFFVKTPLNKRREPNQPCTDHCNECHRCNNVGPDSRSRGVYSRDGCRRDFLLCHNPNRRHYRSPTLYAETNCCRNHMNLTGGGPVWTGFFNLSQAKCETGKKKPRVTIRAFLFLLDLCEG